MSAHSRMNPKIRAFLTFRYEAKNHVGRESCLLKNDEAEFSMSSRHFVEQETVIAFGSECSSSCNEELMTYEEHDEWSMIPSNLSDQNLPSSSTPLSSSSFSPLGEVESLEHYISRSVVSCGAEESVIPRCPRPSLNEKMTKALHICAQWFGGGTLAQVWVPMRSGDHYILTTNEQPFLHDGRLSEYREVSRRFTFAAEVGTSSHLGLPGRVFTSMVPEWTSNVTYYHQAEYLRLQQAINLDVCGSFGLPVFEDSHKRKCCAVFEFVTSEEKPDFDSEMDNICRALQAVDLSSTQSLLLSPESLSSNVTAALAEIKDVLSAICRTHCLPLALIWIPRIHAKNSDHNETMLILCLEETACFWNDPYMEGFVHACKNHFLEEGKGLVGKALQLNEPFFHPDVKDFDVSEYPLVHHARKLGLRAAVAIKIRSAFTGSDEYIVEFFLPLNFEGVQEQLLLVNSLLVNVEMICMSLSEVSDTELVEEKELDIRLLNCRTEDISIAESLNDELHSSDRESTRLHWGAEMSNNDPPEKTRVGYSKQMEKKRNSTEKNISLSVLQQYFSESLKDTAKGLSVSPTTLKRICRQHGISRWPCRKLKMVDHSLKKIQTLLESVPGMEGGLEFDPTKGKVVASFSVTGEEFNHGVNLPLTSRKKLSERSEAIVRTSPTSEFVDVEMREYTSDMIDPLDVDESVLMKNVSSLSTGCLDGKLPLWRESSARHGGNELTVMATLGEKTVSFKFEPNIGCFQLYLEVAKRLELQIGEFQLRYLDDDEEWALMVTDSDFVKCLEVLEVLQTRTVNFEVATRNSGA